MTPKAAAAIIRQSQNMIKDIDRQLNDLNAGKSKQVNKAQPKNQRKQAAKKKNNLAKLVGYNQGSNPQKQQKQKNNQKASGSKTGKVQKTPPKNQKKKINQSQKKKQVKEAPKSQEQLDMELAQYMQKTKGGLDAELDCYMSQER
ncbi:unnamed protein product, partial [Oikopleura dioica]